MGACWLWDGRIHPAELQRQCQGEEEATGIKSSGPNPEPGWEPHPDCSREGQPCPELQGPWERAQGCHPLEEETCRSRSKRGCPASPGQVPPPDKGHFGRALPRLSPPCLELLTQRYREDKWGGPRGGTSSPTEWDPQGRRCQMLLCSQGGDLSSDRVGGLPVNAGSGEARGSPACWVPKQVRRAQEHPALLLAWPKFLPSKITLPGISPKPFRMGEEPVNNA